MRKEVLQRARRIKGAASSKGAHSAIHFFTYQGLHLVRKKIYSLEKSQHVKQEYDVLKFVSSTAAAPKPLAYDPESRTIVMERVFGKPFNEIQSVDLQKLANTIGSVHALEFKKLGKQPFRDFHRIPSDQLKAIRKQIRRMETILNQLQRSTQPEAGAIFSLIQEAIRLSKKRLRAKKPAFLHRQFSVIHRDLSPRNILVDRNGNIVLVDWAESAVGDRAVDLAKLFATNHFTPEQEKEFLAHYRKKIHDIGLVDRIFVYKPLSVANTLLWRIQRLNEFSSGTKHPSLRAKSWRRKSITRIKEMMVELRESYFQNIPARLLSEGISAVDGLA